jgi:hypothetical protein
MRRFKEFLFVVGVTTAFVDTPAHAYLDGGTISLFLQGLTGAVAAGLLFARSYIAKLTGWFRRAPETNSRDDVQG